MPPLQILQGHDRFIETTERAQSLRLAVERLGWIRSLWIARALLIKDKRLFPTRECGERLRAKKF